MLVYGRNTVLEALKSSFVVEEVLLQTEIRLDSKISSLLKLAEEKQVKSTYTSLKNLSKLTGNTEHQGTVCKVNFHDYKLKDIINTQHQSNSFIYISEATYEHNIGAIIRTAECAGLAGVIIPQNINITAIIAKISSGAVFHIPIIKNSIFQTIKDLKKEAFNIIGIEKNGDSLFKSKLTENNLFIIGGEDKSLSDVIRSQCDLIVEIPQFGHVNSLNMSVASAIVIYQYIKQIN